MEIASLARLAVLGSHLQSSGVLVALVAHGVDSTGRQGIASDSCAAARTAC